MMRVSNSASKSARSVSTGNDSYIRECVTRAGKRNVINSPRDLKMSFLFKEVGLECVSFFIAEWARLLAQLFLFVPLKVVIFLCNSFLAPSAAGQLTMISRDDEQLIERIGTEVLHVVFIAIGVIFLF